MTWTSLYSQEVAEAICLRIAEGETLRKICKGEGMPDRATVFRWIAKHDEFRRRYELAKEMMVESFAEEIIAIAADGSNDTITLPNGRQISNKACIERAWVRIKARRWLMARLMPRKYGTGKAIAHSGEIKARPITLEQLRQRVKEANESERNLVQARDMFM